MNIFIWQSYGNVNAYRAETVGDLNVVISLIQTAIAMWGKDEAFERMLRSVQVFASTNRVDRARRELVSFVQQHCSDTDAFELFETTKVL